MNRFRLAGTLILTGILAAVAWRVIVAPAVLGDFDPADLAHRDRAFVSIGNVAVAVLFAFALWLIAAALHGSGKDGLLRFAVISGAAGAIAAAIGTVGLVWWHAPILLLYLYVVAMGAAWALAGFAGFRTFEGGLRWAALGTAIVYALAGLSVIAGAFIIFVMTIAAAPFGIGLLATRQRAAASQAADLAFSEA